MRKLKKCAQNLILQKNERLYKLKFGYYSKYGLEKIRNVQIPFLMLKFQYKNQSAAKKISYLMQFLIKKIEYFIQNSNKILPKETKGKQIYFPIQYVIFPLFKGGYVCWGGALV
ncbi:hypothetical protein [Polaribacter sp. NJDZ03]|uniref:hypothetical protein n=1 Tax=Polaribacter sp. NJDZ03 TaxID=2855841 RepID=UPI001C4A5EF9|nr:hypothetical protein [Polaribacter sp. NJDZ03]